MGVDFIIGRDYLQEYRCSISPRGERDRLSRSVDLRLKTISGMCLLKVKTFLRINVRSTTIMLQTVSVGGWRAGPCVYSYDNSPNTTIESNVIFSDLTFCSIAENQHCLQSLSDNNYVHSTRYCLASSAVSPIGDGGHPNIDVGKSATCCG